MKTIVFELELLLEVRGLQFCLARAHHFLDQSLIYQLYHKPLHIGFAELGVTLPSVTLHHYLQTVRPQAYALSVLQQFHSQGNQLVLLSSLEEECTEQVLHSNRGVAKLLHDVWSVPEIQTGTSYFLNDINLFNDIKDSVEHCVHISFPHVQATESSVESIRQLLHIAGQRNSIDEWQQVLWLPEPILFHGTIVRGFGRGSSELGFPTANVETTELPTHLVPGVYAAEVRLSPDSTRYKASVNIGWCPFYSNPEKSIEAYILSHFPQSLLGRSITVELRAFIRAESAFFDKQDLIQAITLDVEVTNNLF